MNRAILTVIVAGLAGAACAQTVNIWLTTDDQSQLMQPQSPVAFANGTGGTNCIEVDETQHYQQIEGFGAAFTDTTGYNLNEVALPGERTNALINLFTRNRIGIGLSFMRIPMGASDLARYEYSYDDLPAGQTDTNLSDFSIAHDEADIIPIIQSARELNPQMKLMANPWSPPGWMKSSDSMVGGTLLSTMYGPFANYFVKFIQAYQAQGVPIDYIGLQNEPLYQPSDYPGMYMDPNTQLAVMRDYVLPALTANQLTNRLLVYDHNWDTPSYPQTVLSDPTLAGSAQVAGIAWHGYAGTPGAMLSLEGQYPAKGNYETEHSGGSWVSDQVRADFEEIIHVIRSWGKCYLKWNLAGDQNDGPNSGGCNDCTPLVVVNSSSGTVSYTTDFYTLGQFSRFVLPGAYRIYSSDSAGIISAAFLNPDGSKALVAYNDSPGSISFQVQWGNQSFYYSLASYCGATFTWAGTQTAAVAVGATNEIQASSFNAVSNLETEATSDTMGGYDLGYASTGSYAVYKNVNLGAGFASLTARLASESSGGSIDILLDSPTGPLLGSVAIPDTGDWQTWQTQAGAATGGSGVHDLYLVFEGGSGIGNVNWFQFGGAFAPLPSPWSAADVGAVGLVGGTSYTNGVFTMNGSGNDIFNNADACQFAEQPVAGVCEVRARVVKVQETDPWAKAGVMLRESTNAGAVNASVVVTPANGVSFQIRSSTGGTSTSTTAGGVTAPCWVRLARSAANSFAGYYSSDGSHWTQIGASTTVTMSNSACAGLAVTAHNNASNCVAMLDNVSVNQAPVLAPISNQSLLAGQVLTVTNSASDADIPAQTLGFGLLASPGFRLPAGATINTNTGVFVWRPAIAQSPSTQSVSVVVFDSGIPSMSATQSFLVTVGRPARPVISAISVTNGQYGFWVQGDAGPDYTIQVSTNLTSWSAITTATPASLPWFWMDTNAGPFATRFYRTLLGP
jgi:glucosylceramidase